MHKSLYPHSKNSNGNSNNNNDNSKGGSLTGRANGTDPQSEQERLLHQEQEAEKQASPKMILIALGASVGVWYVLEKVLLVQLPKGSWLEDVPYLSWLAG